VGSIGDVEQRNRHGVSVAGELARELAGGDNLEVPQLDRHRDERVLQAGVRKGGGIDACALPEINAVGWPREISEVDVELSRRLLPALHPPGDGGRGDTDAPSQAALAEFQIGQQTPDSESPLWGLRFVQNGPPFRLPGFHACNSPMKSIT
jgi:hypothetical protein